MKNFINILFVNLIFLISAQSFAVDSGLKKTRHAGSVDGLTRIDKDGVYIYDTKNELKNQSSHIRIGSADHPEITVQVEDVKGKISDISFDDIYSGASKLTVGYDYEYYFTQSGGKLGAQLGFSAQYAQGQGRLVIDPSKSSVEKFSFITLPLYAGAAYRFEYKDKQLFAPYIAGGGVYMILAEKREDKSKVNAIGAPGFYGSAGILFNITAMDREMANDFDSEYGISNLWINLEFKTVNVSSDVFDYQSNYIQSGLSFDF
jgi:hypothetical protein